MKAAFPHRETAVASLSARSMELAQLEAEDATVFMADLGIEELAAGRIIRASYDLTGLISFLTTGEDEVRAWPIPRGTKAPQVAGAIHDGPGTGLRSGPRWWPTTTWWPAGAWSRRASGGNCARRAGATWCRTGTR